MDTVIIAKERLQLETELQDILRQKREVDYKIKALEGQLKVLKDYPCLYWEFKQKFHGKTELV